MAMMFCEYGRFIVADIELKSFRKTILIYSYVIQSYLAIFKPFSEISIKSNKLKAYKFISLIGILFCCARVIVAWP